MNLFKAMMRWSGAQEPLCAFPERRQLHQLWLGRCALWRLRLRVWVCPPLLAHQWLSRQSVQELAECRTGTLKQSGCECVLTWGLWFFASGYGYGAPAVSTGGGIGFGEILVLGVLAVVAFQVISSLTNAGGESFGAPSL